MIGAAADEQATVGTQGEEVDAAGVRSFLPRPWGHVGQRVAYKRSALKPDDKPIGLRIDRERFDLSGGKFHLTQQISSLEIEEKDRILSVSQQASRIFEKVDPTN